ncbi:hypothetical protein C2G38_2151584 [Gigaspora rosea]|uniref:Uncharacterized protein n=1 Tax=Gigaspora rosea TaxID=44941 RepID=A0A397W7Z2_9GLOM|nr:hypothetical protein C2G38_2151584 [Gigaspora rosea]
MSDVLKIDKNQDLKNFYITDFKNIVNGNVTGSYFEDFSLCDLISQRSSSEVSFNDNSKDLEYDISEPLSYYDTVTTTNLADGSSQNSLIIRSMRYIIYNSLFYYWDKPIMIGLLASLLDFWLKTLSNWDKETHKKTKEKLKYQFSNCEQTIASEHTVTSKNINTHYNRLHSSIFGSSISRNTTSQSLS